MPRLTASLVILLAAIGMWSSAHAAEGYANCANYIDALPASIGSQGVWCLRQDLSTAITSGAAITITTNNVTIDCNDFKIGGLAAGAGSTAYGIFATDRQNLTVRHCSVRGFLRGIVLQGTSTSGGLVEDNRLDNNLEVGMQVVGSGNLVQRNRIYDTGGATGRNMGWGISAQAHIVDNTVDGVFAAAANSSSTGIVMFGTGSEARGNLVRGLMPSGTGKAVGIDVGGAHQTIFRNRIIAPVTVSGTGILGGGMTTTFCGGNLVANFATPWTACQVPAGNDNASH